MRQLIIGIQRFCVYTYYFPLIVSLLFLGNNGFSEGIKQLMPDSTVSAAGLFIDNTYGSVYTKFALMNCLPNYRLNIHIKQAGETILFGLKSTPGIVLTFNLRKPDGTVALSGICPTASGQTGYIRYFNQAVAGPFPQNSGYIPLSYTVTSVADTGDYYFEIANAPTYTDLIFNYWDFQVVSGQHNPAIPADTVNGRIWSKSWQLYADLGNYVFQPFNGKFFVYSDDGIVTKLAFSNAHVGAVTIFCNPYGCYNTGNFPVDRQSVNTNTFITFPGIAQYKVFLNNPDTLAYPSGEYGQITGTPAMIPDPSYPPCSPEKLIAVSVNKPGLLETILTLTYGAPATDVYFYTQVVSGLNYIAWNGLDGQGNPVPDGTLITAHLNFVNGLTNLPVWDQERNPDGYHITLVRPVGGTVMTPMTYWDDSQLTANGYQCPVAPQTSNLTGCLPGSVPGYPYCHPWGLNQPDCHDKMINTWWFGSASTATFTAIFATTPPNATGHDSTRCGPGTVLLSATVQGGQTVDWYDSITGGNLLLAGDTSFLTPYLTETETYYAEARDTAGMCYSVDRTPVTATIIPLIVPEIKGKSFICEDAGEQTYTTQEGMLNYLWDVTPSGQIISGQGTSSIVVLWDGTGTQTVRVVFTNPTGCSSSNSAVMDVYIGTTPGPAGPVSGPSPLCAGTPSAVFSIEPVSGALIYVWNIPPGLVIVSGSGTNSITVDVLPDASSGIISVYAINFCGAGLPSPPFLLIIHEPPFIFAGSGDTLCQGSAFTFSQATGQNFSNLQWTTNGQGYFSDPGSLNPVYIPSSGDTGRIQFTLIGFAFPPCNNDSSAVSLYYHTAPSADAGPDGMVCEGNIFHITSSSALNYEELHWNTSGSGSFSDPEILHPQYFPSAEDVKTGVVKLTLRATPTIPCSSASDSMSLTLGKAPVASAGTGGVICGGSPFQVVNAQAANYSHIQWIHDGKGILTGDTTLHPVYYPLTGESGDVILTMQVEGSVACSDSIVYSRLAIRIYTGITVDAGPEQIIPDSTSAFLSGSAEGGSESYSYAWEPAELLLNPTEPDPQTQVLTSDTLFILTIKDKNSVCSGKDSVRVKVKKTPPDPDKDCIHVYNVITPNGDGLNDKFIIDCIENYPDNSIRFFTRWGTMISSFEHYDNKTIVWEGTNSKGEPLPDGTYYYILAVKNLDTRTGWVFIRDSSK